jgi:PAS domain S-box-containing protein
MSDPAPPDYSSERYRELIEQVPAVLYEAEPGREGRWRFVSSQLEDLIGDSPEDWIADPSRYLDRIHPDDRDAVVAAEEREFELAKGNAIAYVSEYRMVRDDGSVAWIRDEARLVENHDPPVWRGVLVDITLERRVGAALDEAHARADELVHSPPAESDLDAAHRQIKRLIDGIQEQMKVLERGRRTEPRPGTSGATRRVFTSLDER